MCVCVCVYVRTQMLSSLSLFFFFFVNIKSEWRIRSDSNHLTAITNLPPSICDLSIYTCYVWRALLICSTSSTPHSDTVASKSWRRPQGRRTVFSISRYRISLPLPLHQISIWFFVAVRCVCVWIHWNNESMINRMRMIRLLLLVNEISCFLFYFISKPFGNSSFSGWMWLQLLKSSVTINSLTFSNEFMKFPLFFCPIQDYIFFFCFYFS